MFYLLIQVRIDIPESWLGKEVHLRWSAGCESMIWTSDGIPLQGLNGKVILYVNVICINNEMFELWYAHLILVLGTIGII